MNFLEKKAKRTFVLQQEQKDCGVACLLSLVQYYNGQEELEELRRLCGTDANGTTLAGIKTGAEKLGMISDGFTAELPDIVEYGKPLILHVIKEEYLSHYIVFFGKIEDDKYLIGDPALGVNYMTAEEINAIWKSRSCVTAEATENLALQKNMAKEKWNWFKNLLKEDYPILVVSIVIGVIVSGLGLSMSFYSKKLVDEILPQKSIPKFLISSALIATLLLLREALNFVRQKLMLMQGRSFNLRINAFFFHKLLFLPRHFFDSRSIGDNTARLNDINRIQRVIAQVLGGSIIDILVVLFTLAAAFFLSPTFGLILLCATPIFFLLVKRDVNKITKGQKEVMAAYASTESNFITTLQGINEIKNFNKQEKFAGKNAAIVTAYQASIIKLGKIQIRLSFLINSSSVCIIVGVLIYLGVSVLKGQMQAGSLFAALGICSTLLPSVANLSVIAIPISEAKVAFQRMFDFTRLSEEKVIGELETLNAPIIKFENLTASDVCFRFAGKTILINNLQFSISKGECVGIIGDNGCGKSTFGKLLMRYYDLESGTIMANKTNADNISISNWRQMVHLVPQHPHIFNGSVLDNIAIAATDEDLTKVLLFIKEYELAPLFDSFPQSVLTLLGTGAVHLSDGQRQLIGICRALYHKPSLLILDEATSALDKKITPVILQKLKRMNKDMSILYITHQINIAEQFCDKLMLLENGKLTHPQKEKLAALV